MSLKFLIVLESKEVLKNQNEEACEKDAEENTKSSQ